MELFIEFRRRPRQKTMRLTVKSPDRVLVTANMSCPQKAMQKFVEDSRDFIERERARLRDVRAANPPRQFLSGETFLFRGEARTLDVFWRDQEGIQLTTANSLFEMVAPISSNSECRAKAYQKIMQMMGREELNRRVAHWSPIMGLVPQSVSIRGQATRWGSCTNRGHISLNWRLICAPPVALDYVVIHELSHLQHLNHRSAFWSLVARYIPDWETSSDWLKNHAKTIAQQFERE